MLLNFQEFLQVQRYNKPSLSFSTRSIGLGRFGQNGGAALRFDAAHVAGFGEAATVVQGYHGHSSVQVSENYCFICAYIPGVTGAQSSTPKSLRDSHPSIRPSVSSSIHPSVHQEREIIVSILLLHLTCYFFLAERFWLISGSCHMCVQRTAVYVYV